MPDLLCLGEPLVEFNAQPDGTYWRGFGGDVSNVAIAAARQGADTGIISHLGADPFGQDIMDLWAREGVDAQHVDLVAGQDTGLYFVHHDAGTHHFIYRRRGSACSQMKVADLPEGAIAQTRIFYSSGISLAISAEFRATTRAAMAMSNAAGGLVAFDPNLRERLWSLEEARAVTHAAMRQVDIALPGLDDARRLTARQTPEEIISFYHGLGARIVALTLGADGVAISAGQGIATIPRVPVRAVDATGAGDCFNGIFLARLLAGASAEEAAHLANTGAALSTTGFGAVGSIPYSHDIVQFKEASA